MPVLILGCAASTETVYAVPSISVLLETICGSDRLAARADETGQQTRPLVWRIMKAILSVVTSSAAMIRSPSFSREIESRTTMNWPSSVQYGQPS